MGFEQGVELVVGSATPKVAILEADAVDAREYSAEGLQNGLVYRPLCQGDQAQLAATEIKMSKKDPVCFDLIYYGIEQVELCTV